MKKLLILLLLFTVSWARAQDTEAEKIRVTTLSTILTEIATRVGGKHVEVTGLVQPGVDPHEYEPKPAAIAVVARAQLVLASGKHLEGYLTKLHQSSGSKGTFVEVGDRLPSMEMPEEAGGKHDHAGHAHVEDPHWWHSIGNVVLATDIVRDELIKVDPGHAADYRTNAADYNESLARLQKWARIKVAELPRNQRKLVTSHDAFQYFAKEFSFTIFAIEGISPEDQSSNKKVLSLIDNIRKQRVKAIFGEFGENPKVLEAITRESGAKIGGELHTDGLGTGAAATYEGMIRHNLTTIVDALK
ncbi:MAG TPA: metal ABC transporter substrate-binding protein [Chthoniobacterales bacterium]|jgi:ABC-type Zn uptake system ZnuABC Zn-binding protein ZnuA